MKISFGDTTLEVDFEEGDDEFLGSSHFEINLKLYAAVYDSCPFDHGDAPPEFDPEENDDDETIMNNDADSMIDFLRACRLKGGTVEFSYWGNPYWFFHDLDHAENDAHNQIDGSAEARALVGGAVKAREHGIKLGIIFGELAKATPQYKERFGEETDAIEVFGEYLEESLTTASN